MDRERLSILKMIEKGRVTAEEGLRLLEALDRPGRAAGRSAARRLRVRVSELGSGRSRIQVNIPIELAELGLRLAARGARPRLRFGSWELDAKQISEAVRSSELGRILDYTDDEENARVEVFLE